MGLFNEKELKLVEKDVLTLFSYSKRNFDIIEQLFSEEMDKGLNNQSSSLSMIPTYIYSSVPKFIENSHYFSLDFGGSNLRFTHYQYNKEKKALWNVKTFQTKLPQNIKEVSTSIDVFNIVAKQLSEWIKTLGLLWIKEPIKLGLTFSFPYHQLSPCKSEIIQWTKGFKSKVETGDDAVKLLTCALTKDTV